MKSGSVRQITATSCLEDYPQLSPDGRTLLFFSDRASQSGLYTLGIDGTGLQPLTPPGIPSTLPRWSPDGTRFAFVRQAASGWSLVLQPVGGLSVWSRSTFRPGPLCKRRTGRPTAAR